MNAIFKIFCALSLLVLCVAGGCANYGTGNASPLPFKRVYVAGIANESLVPQAQSVLGAMVREALLNSGLQIAKRADAQAVLTITLTQYRREAASYSADDTMEATAYNLLLQAQCTLTDASGKTVYFKNVPQEATVQIKGTSGLAQAEYGSIPLLTRDLAQKIALTTTTLWAPKPEAGK